LVPFLQKEPEIATNRALYLLDFVGMSASTPGQNGGTQESVHEGVFLEFRAPGPTGTTKSIGNGGNKSPLFFDRGGSASARSSNAGAEAARGEKKFAEIRAAPRGEGSNSNFEQGTSEVHGEDFQRTVARAPILTRSQSARAMVDANCSSHTTWTSGQVGQSPNTSTTATTNSTDISPKSKPEL
jgi:hypothetical protein